MKKKFLIISALMLAVLLLFGCAAQDNARETELKNGDFEKYGGEESLPNSWDFSTYRGTSSAKCESDSDRGGVLHIIAGTDDDASVYQTVEVEPLKLYRLSCWIKTKGVGDGTGEGAGANIALCGNIIARTDKLDGTADWTYVEMYGRTGSDQKQMTVSCRVGGYSAEAHGEAWFDDFRVEQVDKAKGIVLSFSTGETVETADGGGSSLVLWIIIGIAVLAAVFAAALIFYKINSKKYGSADDPSGASSESKGTIPPLESYADDKARNMRELSDLKGRSFFNVGGNTLPGPTDLRLKLKKRDIIYVLAVTLVYGIVSFFRLGTTNFPESRYEANVGDSVRIEFGRSVKLSDVWQNPGISHTKYKLVTDSGKEIKPSGDDYGAMYRWRSLSNVGAADKTTGVTLIVTGSDYSRPDSPALIMLEMAFFDENGELIECTVPDEAKALFDEQGTIPEVRSYYNGMYFDELYHGRTALEHIENLPVYEWTHPPLGKLIIAIGILIFGMNPFGWRVMGVVFGILMVPIMYFLAKRLLKRSELALFSAVLFAFDFIHFTQSRISTVDVFAVFFILLMTYYMLEFLQMDIGDGVKRMIRPLALSGLFFGLGCATKWICIYTGGGLAVAFFVKLALMWLKTSRLGKKPEYANDRAVNGFWRKALELCAWCVLFFIVVPAVIYSASYFRYYTAQWKPAKQEEIYKENRDQYNSADEVKLSFGQFIEAYFGKKVQTEQGTKYQGGVLGMQNSMFSYHAGLKTLHNGSTTWWTWLLDLRPTWFYIGEQTTETLDSGEKVQYVGTINAFGNPMVWTGCNIATIALLLVVCFRGKKFTLEVFFILVFIAFNLLPWVLVPRTTYAYHFFATVPYTSLAAGYLLGYFEDAAEYLLEKKRSQEEQPDRVRKASINRSKTNSSKRAAKAGSGFAASLKRFFGVIGNALKTAFCYNVKYVKFVWIVVALIFFGVFFPVFSGVPARKSYISSLEWVGYHRWEYYQTEQDALSGKDPYRVDRIGWTFMGYEPSDVNKPENAEKYITKIVKPTGDANNGNQ